MKKTAFFAALCMLGLTTALPASADRNDHDRRGHWSHRDHDRGYERHRGYDRPRHFNRHHGHRDYGRRYRDYDRHSYRNYAPRRDYGRRHVPHGRYCDDWRHYRGVHYHVAPRYYFRDDFPRHSFHQHGSYGGDATLILTLPF